MNDMEWSDRDLEDLFAGRGPTEGGLACLSPFIESLRREALPPTEGHVSVVARTLAEAAKGAQAAPSRPTVKAPAAWRRRLVTIGGVAALATVGVGGAAIAADGAAPGDLLYSVDQAFESIGVRDGGTEERLHEAARMTERGNVDGALKHAAKAVQQGGDEDAAQALVQTALEVQNQGAEQSIQVRAEVSEMLKWMGDTDSKGQEFGQGVSERTQQIKDSASKGKSAEAPGQNKEDDEAPGNSSGGRSNDNPGKGSKD